jgi:uncharacterized MnhB-related membrane protein
MFLSETANIHRIFEKDNLLILSCMGLAIAPIITYLSFVSSIPTVLQVLTLYFIYCCICKISILLREAWPEQSQEYLLFTEKKILSCKDSYVLRNRTVYENAIESTISSLGPITVFMFYLLSAPLVVLVSSISSSIISILFFICAVAMSRNLVILKIIHNPLPFLYIALSITSAPILASVPSIMIFLFMAYVHNYVDIIYRERTSGKN